MWADNRNVSALVALENYSALGFSALAVAQFPVLAISGGVLSLFETGPGLEHVALHDLPLRAASSCFFIISRGFVSANCSVNVGS